MKRSFAFSALAAFAALVANGDQARADGALDLIPGDSHVVVRLKNPEETVTKLAGFVNQVQPGAGFFIQGQAQALGVVISNPTLGGVDMKDDWYISVKINKGDLPHVTFYVPATNVDAMTEAIGENFSTAIKGNWVAYSESEEAASAVKDCISGKKVAVSKGIDRRSNALLTNNEISAYINVKAIGATFADELELADQQLDTMLEQFGALIPETPGMNLGAAMKMYGDLGHGALQAVQDSEAFTAGIGITESALTIEELLVVKDGSKTDRALQKHRTSELGLIKNLPQDRVAYFGIHGDMQGLMAWGLNLAGEMFGDNKDAKDKIAKAKEIMSEVKVGQIAGTFKLNDDIDNGIFTAIALTEATPAEKMRDFTANAALETKVPGMKQTITVKKNAEKFGDLSADVVTTKQEFDENVDPTGTQQEIIDLLYGPNGLVQRIVTTKDHVIQTTGGNAGSMKEAIASFKSPATTNEALGDARGMVMKKANFVALVDLPNLVVNALKTAVATGKVPVPIPVDAVPNVDPGFVAFSVGTETQGLRMKTAIPAKALVGFVKIGQAFQGARGGGF